MRLGLGMGATLALLLFLLLGGCDFSSGGGGGGPPGSISGDARYAGPPLACDGDRILGQLILRLHDVDRPDEPPDTTMVVRGDRLFESSACGSVGEPDVMQTGRYQIDNVRAGRTYRLVAFWDSRSDFDQLDALRDEPTRGDVLGGAFQDPTATPRAYQRLELGPGSETLEDVAVSITDVVHSERPFFRLASSGTPLDSAAVWSTATDPIERDREAYALTNAALELMPVADDPYRSALVSAGLTIDDGVVPHAFWAQPWDDDGDGVPDAHPILGDGILGDLDELTRWLTPAVVMRRHRTAAETDGGVPDVYLYPAVRPSESTVREVFAPSVPLLVPPVAILVLDPDLPVCRVPVFAPGNVAAHYEGAPIECQELPTGNYEISVKQGIAGGMLTQMVPASISDTGFRVTGGVYAGQSWEIPNELQDLLIDQGPGGRFLVLDRMTDDAPDPMSTEDGHGSMACAMAADDMGMPRAVSYTPIAPACCEPIRHLCGIPLCDPTPIEDGFIRQADSMDGDAPSCLPFLMPPSCCR